MSDTQNMETDIDAFEKRYSFEIFKTQKYFFDRLHFFISVLSLKWMLTRVSKTWRLKNWRGKNLFRDTELVIKMNLKFKFFLFRNQQRNRDTFLRSGVTGYVKKL